MSSIDAYKCILPGGREVLIRSGICADADRVFALVRASVLEEQVHDLNTLEDLPTREHERKWVEMLEQAPEKVLLLAESQGDVVGFISFNNGHLKRLAHQGEISISVKQEWRDQGLGRQLFLALFAWAEKHPRIEKLSLQVVSTNMRAIHLYQALGFVEEGRLHRQAKIAEGQYIDLVFMGKWLNRDIK
ncbi:GNAT family N-acetyltransferase [Ktedonobacter sp. SOSP1-85]|uniref:GNAT family N-acetyltransferase n=1 Tax=Ktedonobacter sp. SOSP1-85 TaxID=2778367 RepID=UPI0019153017|nr:GNAT family protein [Ktedonobacter sp. SOSP1-85]